MGNRKKILLSSSVLLIFAVLFVLIKTSYIFEEARPFATLHSIVQLNLGQTSVKMEETDLQVTFMTKKNQLDLFFKEHLSDWSFKEQVGAGYVFEKSGNEITLQSRQVSKGYVEWIVPAEVMHHNE